MVVKTIARELLGQLFLLLHLHGTEAVAQRWDMFP
jgi:hypothetical protein